jgi:hypothetical protein
MLVGDDCRTLGIGYNGSNLLDPADREPGTPVMTFFREGGPGRVVRLGDLYPDPAVLPRTVSHLLWRQQDGWDGRRWTVHTVDGRVLEFGP